MRKQIENNGFSFKPKIYLKKGASITCPNCLKSILEVSRDTFQFEIIVPNMVRLRKQYEKEYEYENPLKCPNCKRKFLTIMAINQIEGKFYNF